MIIIMMLLFTYISVGMDFLCGVTVLYVARHLSYYLRVNLLPLLTFRFVPNIPHGFYPDSMWYYVTFNWQHGAVRLVAFKLTNPKLLPLLAFHFSYY
jgi:hypothetical protein